MYSSVFEKSFLFILKWEGGYVNDPDDPGGETKYGLSKRQYPNLDIKNLTVEQAKDIYYKDYWLKGKCDKLELFSNKLAFIHFNYCVNTGIKRASKFLQQSIQKYGYEITIDGIIGSKTLSLLKQCDKKFVYESYTNNATCFYTELVDRKPTLRKFYRGWMNRVIDAYKYGLQEFIN